MTIDLCVVNFNTKDKLIRLLNTLTSDLPNDGVESNYTIRVADNGSTDGSVRFLEQSFVRDGTVYNDNIGYARASNQLAAMGEGDIIGLLNADVWLTSSDVAAIEQSFEDRPEVAIIGPKQRDERGHIRSGPIKWVGDRRLSHLGFGQYDPKDRLYREQEMVATVSGSAYFIRRLVWEELTNCPIYQDEEVVRERGGLGGFLPTDHYF